MCSASIRSATAVPTEEAVVCEPGLTDEADGGSNDEDVDPAAEQEVPGRAYRVELLASRRAVMAVGAQQGVSLRRRHRGSASSRRRVRAET